MRKKAVAQGKVMMLLEMCVFTRNAGEFFFAPSSKTQWCIFFGHENSLFGHNQFSTLFFSMKVAESEKIVLASCIIGFKDIHVWLRHFSLNLNACKVMTVFFKIPGEILKKTVWRKQFVAKKNKTSKHNLPRYPFGDNKARQIRHGIGAALADQQVHIACFT